MTRQFLGRPALGGWLTIGNCAAWATLICTANFTPAGLLSNAAALIFGLPLAAFFLLSDTLHHSPSAGEEVLRCVATGLNSILWGYGIAFLIKKFRKWRSKREPRGFEIILPAREE